MSKQSLLRGAMWGTIAVFISKFLGFIYLIPFNSVLDVDQQIIFTSSYRIYAYVLLIATAGIPFATANMIARYNAVGNYQVSFKLLKSNIFLMLAIGAFCSILVIIFAHPLAKLIITQGSSEDLINNVTIGIRISSLALIFVPIISVVRGFFQGYKEIQTSAMSQLVEQFINAFFILAILLLAGAGLVSNLFAVYFATLCATLGSIASLFYLVHAYQKSKSYFNSFLEQDVSKPKDIKTSKLLKELFAISIPYIGVILLGQSNDLIDLFYTIRGLVANGFTIEMAQEFSTIYGMSVIKLMTIPMTISTGLSIALVPHLAEAHAKKDYQGLQELVIKILTGTIVILFPIALIMMATSKDTFIVIGAAKYADYGAYIFNYFAIYSIINTFTIIVDNMMLTLNQRKRILVFSMVSTIVKLSATYFLIAFFGILGLALSSIIVCLLTLIPSMLVLKNRFKLNYRKVFTNIFYSLAVASLVYLIIYFLAHNITTTSYATTFIKTVLLYLLGFAIYFIIGLRINLIPAFIKEKLLGRFSR